MASPFDLLSGGLATGGGLTGVTRGFLVDQPGLLTQTAAALPVAPGVMTDVALLFNAERREFDAEVTAGDLRPERTLLTSVILSLFTDRRAEPGDEIPDGSGDPRGWWGDSLLPTEDQMGSRLWLLAAGRESQATLVRAREMALEALEWLRQDGIASRIQVDTTFLERGVMRIDVEIFRPELARLPFRFFYLWQGLD